MFCFLSEGDVSSDGVSRHYSSHPRHHPISQLPINPLPPNVLNGRGGLVATSVVRKPHKSKVQRPLARHQPCLRLACQPIVIVRILRRLKSDV